jgi:hypothetical protein
MTEVIVKRKKKQQSKRVVFRPTNPKTFHTLDLALVTFPDTSEKDWLIADSTIEYERFCFLLQAQAQGIIAGLYFHPAFILLPQTKLPKNAFKDKWTQAKVGYEADFSYNLLNGIFVVEDVKAVYSNSPANIAKKRAGKPIIESSARLRHKFLVSQLFGLYGANAHFKIVTAPEAPLMEA